MPKRVQGMNPNAVQCCGLSLTSKESVNYMPARPLHPVTSSNLLLLFRVLLESQELCQTGKCASVLQEIVSQKLIGRGTALDVNAQTDR